MVGTKAAASQGGRPFPCVKVVVLGCYLSTLEKTPFHHNFQLCHKIKKSQERSAVQEVCSQAFMFTAEYTTPNFW